ncbi:MAG: PadR family transcriptional regulator [Pseudomonadota bacterium]|jgi:DNA-binding PadR family transcriptional regulator|nr:PadR family transcriptional regulator [Sphingomonas sp.]MDQ3478016.1 PadR family transcriptional regulator [Pseudomonadota bacterium]
MGHGHHGGCGNWGSWPFREELFGMGPSGPGPWSAGFGPFHFDFGGPPGDSGRGRRGRRGRMFGSGQLRLVLLKLIADEPRHGYDLIRAIEELTGGDYAPSPGIVYPTLTLLQDMGLIEEAPGEGGRKPFQVTEEGRAHLEENTEDIDELFERLEATGSHRRRGQRPEMGRAVGNLMAVLKNRVAQEGWNETLLNEVIDILDDAAQRIERVK